MHPAARRRARSPRPEPPQDDASALPHPAAAHVMPLGAAAVPVAHLAGIPVEELVAGAAAGGGAALLLLRTWIAAHADGVRRRRRERLSRARADGAPRRRAPHAARGAPPAPRSRS